MKKLVAFSLASLMLSGCVNVFTVRNPFSDTKVKSAYQSTMMAAGASAVVAFPQQMSDCPDDYGFKVYNIFTVPLGIVCFADSILESVVDTVCLPFDIPVSNKRNKKKGMNHE